MELTSQEAAHAEIMRRVDEAGGDLLDGIHPNATTGRSKLAAVIGSRLMQRLQADSPLT